MKERKLIIGISIALLVLGGLATFFYFKKQKQAGGGSDEVVWNRERAGSLLRELSAMADSVGIDTAGMQLSAADNEAKANAKFVRMLMELRYGIEPGGLVQQKLKENVDTTWAWTVLKRSMESDRSLRDSALVAASFTPYAQLVRHYDALRAGASADTLKALRKTLNFYRYLNRFDLDKFVVVNIPAAELNVYDQVGKRLMPMEVIAGNLKNPTPLFTSYLTEITAYPYWNVPEGIAVKELLPKIQRDPGYLDSQNLQVIDRREKEVDPYTIDWASLSADNFPYRLRQTSGCHNSLGLIKFTLTGPGAIYMHDTNARNLFSATNDRWRSHGCMRLEKPVELANFLLQEPKFDEGFYNRCLINQKPEGFKLPRPYPVFVIYNLADVDSGGQLRFYKDVYNKG